MRSDMALLVAQRRHTRRGPAHRFLRSRVGRPWDAVYAEICEQCRGRRVAREEFLRHVERNVRQVGGELHGGGRCGDPGPMRPGQLYVCPSSGLLRVTKERSRRPTADGKRRFVRLDALHQCRVLDGVWHLVTLKRLPPDPRQSREQDVVLNRPVRDLTGDVAQQTYGDKVFAVAARKMSEQQLAQYRITDEP
jgi:hypothetical protein